MNFKSVLKAISAIIAIAGAIAAIYFAVKKLTGTKEVEYFDDDDFFECDNDLEIVEAPVEETVVEEAPKTAPKKTTAKKATPKNEN